MSVVCCQVEVSATGWSLFQRSSTECSVSEYDREASITMMPWLIRSCCAMEKKRTPGSFCDRKYFSTYTASQPPCRNTMFPLRYLLVRDTFQHNVRNVCSHLDGATVHGAPVSLRIRAYSQRKLRLIPNLNTDIKLKIYSVHLE
jgi:hypothetical protein